MKLAVIAAVAAVTIGVPASASAAGPLAGRPAGLRMAIRIVPGPWAGYIDEPNTGTAVVFHTVSALFRVPALNCTVTPAGQAIQGVGLNDPPTLVGSGVESSCAGGVQSNVAGWQMPVGAPPSPFTGELPVATGDLVQASVTYDLHLTYTLAVTDHTTGAGFAVRQKCTAGCNNDFAEVITQRLPGGVPLADFATLTFNGITVSDYGAAACRAGPMVRHGCWQTVGVTMVPANIHHAVPGPLAGNSFGNLWRP
jgi:hypothetical protein